LLRLPQRERDFARAVEAHGLIWVGPAGRRDRRDGRQDQRANLMAEAGVPVAPGTHDPAATVEAAIEAAATIGIR
jgi:acetyl-CoA carboxylase biotin carboxylase subunit